MNFHNEITKLQERVAALEAQVNEQDAKLPAELVPAREGFLEVGGLTKIAAVVEPESKAGTQVQTGPVPVAEKVAEAQGSGTEKYSGAGDWAHTEGAGLTDNTAPKVPTQAETDAVVAKAASEEQKPV